MSNLDSDSEMGVHGERFWVGVFAIMVVCICYAAWWFVTTFTALLVWWGKWAVAAVVVVAGVYVVGAVLIAVYDGVEAWYAYLTEGDE